MISVNHKALELAAQDMVAKAKEIKGVLDALDQDIHNDVMAWGGQAKASYIPAKRQWDESLATGTGFPNVFYLRYGLYRNYFPLMALHYANAGIRSAHAGAI